MLESASTLAAHPDVDGVDINSNPLARLRMDPLFLGQLVQLLKRSGKIIRIRDVGPDGGLQGRQFSPYPVERSFVQVQHDDARALLEKACRRRHTDAARATGDEHPFVF